MAYLGVSAAKSAFVLNVLLGAALLITSVAVFFRPLILRWAGGKPYRWDGKRAVLNRWTLLLGVMLGVLVSITSVGAGALGTTALLILYPRLPIARIAGSDIAHAVPLTFIAGIGRWLMGSVDLTLMIALLAGTIPGIIVGSLLRRPARLNSVLRPILAATLLVSSVRLLTA